MKLPKSMRKSMRKRIKEEREKIFTKMSEPGITLDEWKAVEAKYRVYSEMGKSSWKFTPDTLLIVGGNLIGILLILNFEKLDIVRSKAIGFVLKGRV